MSTDPGAFSDALPPERPAEPIAVHVALSRVMADVRAIPKTHEHDAPGARFMFRGIEDVQAALQPALVRHGVLALPTVLERRELPERRTNDGKPVQAVALHIEYRFVGPAGDTLSCTAWGEGQDRADKATGKAESAAMKVALLQALCIPTEDQADGDRVDPPEQAETPEQAAERDELARRAIAAAGHASEQETLQNVGAYAHRVGVLDRKVIVDGGTEPWSPRQACELRRQELEEQATADRSDDETEARELTAVGLPDGAGGRE